jgi:uncharacterized membrane protein (DUF485 family)
MGNTRESLYDLIGVRPDASKEEITDACLRLGDLYRPDQNPSGDNAASKFAAIEVAYAVLSDPAKRAAYDHELASPPLTPTTPPKHNLPSKQDPGHVLSHLMPAKVLAQLRALAQKYQREEIFRSYVARRAWFLVPIASVFTLLILVTVVAAMLLTLRLFSPLIGPLTKHVVFVVGAIVWIGLTIAMLYVSFSWLAKRALRRYERKSVRRPNT